MAGSSGSQHSSLYKVVNSQPWKESFRRGCLERMRNSRDRLLSRYRRAGGNMGERKQKALLVQEVMEEEWKALQSVDSAPAAVAQLEELMDLTVLEEIQQELFDQGITPGGAQGTIWDAGNQTWVGHVQGKRPTRCAIAPAPSLCFQGIRNFWFKHCPEKTVKKLQLVLSRRVKGYLVPNFINNFLQSS
ncbi:RPA-interacting protein isoform X2 [Sorex araneus]|uniref:RPA-interacting protein isoform X2 n=1 Tax=Sorex araneus TaxID=42254 RepID=UPI0024339197|nr:RPA-interacting protein isoform X2 [Sorex araneus]